MTRDTITELRRPIIRRIGRLVVTITPDGVELRGYRRRKYRRFVTWSQIASLSGDDCPVTRVAEHETGTRELIRFAADPTKPAGKTKGEAKQ